MAEQSLYRRHRPQAFDQVVGQEHVVRTLSNAVERDRVHHAYLFVGSRGTGKTSLAKILARSLNCVEGPTLTPCGVCDSCRTIAAGTSLDVVEMDAASNRSVDDIRELRERVGYAPTAGRWKVYILDEAHMLTREAWNAFLKTLEEPPPNTTFVLATTEAHKVMPTIVDRCQRFDFQRPSLEQLAEVIGRVSAEEQIEIDSEAIAAIARSASGSFRDALGTLDQLVAYGGKTVSSDDVLAVLGIADGELILAATDAIAAGDGRAALGASERLSASGRDVTQFGRDLLAHLRQLLVIRTIGSASDTFSVASTDPERLAGQASEFADLSLARSIDVVAAALAAVREGDEPRMTIEMAILRAARPQLDPTREALAERLAALEARLGPGEDVPPPAPAPAEQPAERPSAPAVDTAPAAAPRTAAEAPEPEPAPGPAADPERSTEREPAPEPEAAPGPGVDPERSAAPEPEPGPAPAPDPPPAPESVPEPPPAASLEPPEPDPPALASPPAAAAATEVAELTLERAREAWDLAIARLAETGGAVLRQAVSKARPISVDSAERRIEIGFLESEAFSKGRAESEPARTQIAEALEAELGVRLRPIFVIADAAAIEPPAAEMLSSDELIDRLKSEFDAEELYHAPEPEETTDEARGARRK